MFRSALRPALRRSLPAALLAGALAAGPAAAQPDDARVDGDGALTAAQEEAVRALIEETLRERPEIILEALQDMQRREQQLSQEHQRETLARLAPELESSPVLPVLGNPEGAVTLVEFFDYQCPYCRAVVPTIEAAIEDNDDLRVVLIETPVLGEVSQFAARAAIASTAQGDDAYRAFHTEMMATEGRLSEDLVLTAAGSAGLDVDRLRQDMGADFVEAELARSLSLAREVGLRGTPFFVIGGTSVPGAIDAERLQDLIDAARTAG